MRTIRKPPLLQEIARVEDEIRIERAGDVIDFKHLADLRRRHTELVAWARTNGWGTTPDDTTPAPAAPMRQTA